MKLLLFYRNLLALLILPFIGTAQVQSYNLDSLLQLIEIESNISKKIDLINQVSFLYFDSDVVKGDSTTELAIQLAVDNNDKKGEGWARAYRGVYLLFYGSLDDSEILFKKSYEIGLEIDDNDLQIYSLNGLANTFRDEGLIDSALTIFDKALLIERNNPSEYYESTLRLNKARSFLILDQPDSALIQAKISLQKRRELGNTHGIPDVLVIIATCYTQKHQYNLANLYFDEVRKLDSKTISTNTHYLTSLGELYFQLGNFSRAIENWQTVFRKSNLYKYKYNMGYILTRIGSAYGEEGLFSVSIEYLSEAAKISHSGPHYFIEAEALLQLSWVYYYSRKYSLAEESVDKAKVLFKKVGNAVKESRCTNLKGLIKMAEGNYDSANYFFQVGLSERQLLKNNHEISNSLFLLGKLSIENRDYVEALELLQKGLRLDKDDQYSVSNFNLLIGTVFNRLNRYDSALYYLNKTEEWALKNSTTQLLLACYDELAICHQHQGNQALTIEYLKSRIILNDSIFSDKLTQGILAHNGLELVREKDNEIQKLLNENQTVVKQSERQQRILSLVSIVVFILLIIAISYYVFNKKLKALHKEVSQKSTTLELTNEQLQSAINKLNLAQDQLIQSEKMASIGVMASGVAHELNNPLNFINGGAEALSKYIKNNPNYDLPKIESYINIIKEGVKRSSTIVNGLNQFSRQSEEDNDRCDIHQIINNCLTVLNNRITSNITVVKMFTEHELVIAGNEGKLHQAFLNIIFNSIQSIKSQGKVMISTSIDSNKDIVVIIKDTGVGISTGNLRKIGDPFFTTKPSGEGTGLGMYITLNVIKAHNGTVTLTSEENKGTQVEIKFRVSESGDE